MKILFGLSGLHRFDRGAETAFMALANELVTFGHDVTLIGSGAPRPNTSYSYRRARTVSRERFERFPSIPFLRNECSYEELFFAPDLFNKARKQLFDLTVTCGYPFTNWALRALRTNSSKPKHVFVTQNGDWPAFANDSEYRFFSCDGLVCTNPDFFERNRNRWNCVLIPNGVDLAAFKPGDPKREQFGIPPDKYVVLMVSALIESKRVMTGIEAVSRLPNAHLVVAGQGPLRKEIMDFAERTIKNRFSLLSVPATQMPSLYRSADVFLHLSKQEAFGNVYVEALASGLPIVAPDTERVRWIVGDSQELTGSDDLADICNAIERAVARGSDQRQRNVALAERFSWRGIARDYSAFFQSVQNSP